MKTHVRSLIRTIALVVPVFLPPMVVEADDTEKLRVASLVDGELELEWLGEMDRYYFVQKSLTLGSESWQLYPLATMGDGGLLSAFIPVEENAEFYRLIHTDDPDSDLVATDYIGTGLSAGILMQLGYNPFVWTDSTGNQIHDAWEEYYFNMIGIDPEENDDADFTNNLEEFQLGLDPTVDERPSAFSYTYDPLGRLTGASSDILTLSYTLDEEGNILTRN